MANTSVLAELFTVKDEEAYVKIQIDESLSVFSAARLVLATTIFWEPAWSEGSSVASKDMHQIALRFPSGMRFDEVIQELTSLLESLEALGCDTRICIVEPGDIRELNEGWSALFQELSA